MKKLLNNPWVAGALALVAIVVVASTLHEGGAGGRQAALTGAGDVEFAGEDLAGDGGSGGLTAADIRRIVLGLAIPEMLPDPFASSESKAPAAAPQAAETERFRLSGIWDQAGETLVLINNHILRAGDRLGRVAIESADLDGAWLSHAQGREFLALGSEFTLVTATGPSTPAGLALHEN